MENSVYSVWLQSILGVANKRIHKIIDVFATPKNIFDTDVEILNDSGLFSKSELKCFENKDLTLSKTTVDRCRIHGINIVTIFDDNYPQALLQLEDSPIVLYYKGRLPNFEETPSIAIVGPRIISDFGKKAAFSLSLRFAKSGMIVVSGGAVGGDAFAHKGAVKCGGKTVMVLGCGLLCNYLPENEALRKSVLEKGAIISEYPPDSPALGFHFPVRNRIIAALTLGTIVVEAGAKSGALITANIANDLGRDVFVIPGSPVKSEYKGSNALLRDGAKPLLDASDVFNEYIPTYPNKIDVEKAFSKDESRKDKIIKNISEMPLSNEANLVYNHLKGIKVKEIYPELFTTLGISNDEILSALIELEISGIIKAAPGGKYIF